MRYFILCALSFIPLTSYSISMPQSKTEFCDRFGDRPEDKEIIQEFSNDPVNLLAIKNNGGLLNGGVCWWHSRFQRNAFYLTIFRPDLPKPKTYQERAKIIRDIRVGQRVVQIPGYTHMEEFSLENKQLIQQELNSWQIYDGVVLNRWVDGLRGRTRVKPEFLAKLMQINYEYVNVQKKIAYQKLQIKGIMSHAWLIVGMRKNENGFDLGIIDSNSPQMTKTYSYKTGDDSFYVKEYGNFVPYLEFKMEEERLTSVGRSYCRFLKN
ncbi:MAG: hypothetical protein AB7I27_08015 [Bacteriovoracaceae bacterium]